MKYFINTGTLIIIVVIFAFMCLGFLTKYTGKKAKPKAKKNADPYRKNPYVYAHKQMHEEAKTYKKDTKGMTAEELEKYERKYGTPKTSTNVEDWFRF